MIRVSAVPLLLLAVACVQDDGLAPATVRPDGSMPNAAILPPSAYTASVYKPPGGFRDVNGRNLIVGTAGGNAVAMVLGGPLTNLHNGPGIGSSAEAVNERGEIVGAVDVGSPQRPQEMPAYWRRPGIPPVLPNDPGIASDINDHGLVVWHRHDSTGNRQGLCLDAEHRFARLATTSSWRQCQPSLAPSTTTASSSAIRMRMVA